MPIFIPAMTEHKALPPNNTYKHVFIPPVPGYRHLPPNIIVTENQIREILRKADSNGDGRLSKEELKKAFIEFGSKMPGWRACRLLRKADTNHDGVLTMEELDTIVDFALARYTFRK
ncbi:hypothetical protein AAZX31_17G230100 [Glycine max]|uniref:calmodulin-like protein 4 n=1 Tax=Glycine max TaxID=3847 RepID=UPI0007190B75|nr:calmodulin-like protein 4 [Glycine max]KAG4931638.1 hypothetical protein JHK86_048599 [Glycine max]KAG5098895.1 hypothetical protein JHK82_048749 [Glycine max]KAG5103662.1 hypothetical protein JHK84_048631 [Glycine max]|eukprot:XP_014625123.1 calmodulin-like protein 4 [Glycine max]